MLFDVMFINLRNNSFAFSQYWRRLFDLFLVKKAASLGACILSTGTDKSLINDIL